LISRLAWVRIFPIVDEPLTLSAPDRRVFMSGVCAAAVFLVQLHFDFVLDDNAQEEIKAWSRHRHRR
jgi:hypothetical protein